MQCNAHYKILFNTFEAYMLLIDSYTFLFPLLALVACLIQHGQSHLMRSYNYTMYITLLYIILEKQIICVIPGSSQKTWLN